MPLLARPGRDDVSVPGEAQQRALLAADGPQVRDRAERHALDAKSRCRQTLRDEIEAAVIFGTDGWSADQFLRERERGVGGQVSGPGQGGEVNRRADL
jgi:hypothetical protein